MSLLPVEGALAGILAAATPTEPETVALGKAASRVLAEPLVARRTQPPFAASAMDGYAVRTGDLAADAQRRLRVIGESAAGHGHHGPVGPGETLRILTGAPLPGDTDAVVPQEEVTLEGDWLLVAGPQSRGRHVRPPGLDFHAGEMLLPAGRRLGPRELALVAASGAAELVVRRRPRVALLSVGDELVAPGTPPARDQILASTAPGLMELVVSAGAEAADLGIVHDRTERVAARVTQAAEDKVDILVTIGGASVGTHDVVRVAMIDAGVEIEIWRIAMRPGKPLIFGRRQGMAVLGLPGNPVSSLVCALLFLVPLIARLLGREARDASQPATLAVDMPANDVRQTYLRAHLERHSDALPSVRPAQLQDSSMLKTLAETDCLLVRPPNAPPAKAGSICRIIPLP
jgi:molybdopterin molybdotransferase